MAHEPRVFIITGAMAAGKSTVAQALASKIPKSVHLRGDVFRKMIVNGAEKMGPTLSHDARLQLHLRQQLSCIVVRQYHIAGFTVIYQDILIGHDLERVARQLSDLNPITIALIPDVATLLARDKSRHKTTYTEDFPPQVLANALAADPFDFAMRIDSTTMNVDQVVSSILAI